MKKLLLILLCVPLMFSCGENNEETKKEDNVPENICDTEPDFILSVEELETELKEDIEKTNKKYHGKILQLTGGYYSFSYGPGEATIQLYPRMLMKFYTDSIIRISGVNIGYNDYDDYIKSLPKHIEYSLKTKRSGKGVGDITIKGLYNNKPSKTKEYNWEVYIEFLRCCVVKE